MGESWLRNCVGKKNGSTHKQSRVENKTHIKASALPTFRSFIFIFIYFERKSVREARPELRR